MKQLLGILLLALAATAPRRPATITGTLTVEVKDFSDGHSETDLYVVPDDAVHKRTLGPGGRLRLVSATKGRAMQAAGNPPALTGSKVRVTGHEQGRQFATQTLQVVEKLMPLAFGEQKTLVLLVNFTDERTTPYTADAMRSLVFTTVNNFDLENSFGKMWLTGDVHGWYTIAQSSTVCDTTTLAIEARSAATADGVDTSRYARTVYIFPNNACGFWGMATVGGTNSSAFINGSPQLQVVAHEMGHNLGLLHSHSPAGGEYGDGRCNMGYSIENWNAFQKELTGYMNSAGEPSIAIVTGTGTMTLDPFEGAASGPNAKALKIGQTYLEYRTAAGSRQIAVHRGDLANGNSSELVALLTAGQSYTDPAGVAIRAGTLGATATVDVNPPGPTATPTRAAATATPVPAPRTPTSPPGATATPGPGATGCGDDFGRPDGPLGNGWTVRAGSLALKGGAAGNAATSATSKNLATRSCEATTLGADFVVQTDGGKFGIVLRYQADGSYLLAYRQTGGTSILAIVKVSATGQETPLKTSAGKPATLGIGNPVRGAWFPVTVTQAGATITVSSGGRSLAAVDDGTPATGTSGFLVAARAAQAADNFRGN